MAKTVNSTVTALYERLSKDDELQGESNSILNQKKYLEGYAAKNGFTNIIHYTDDGYTGTNFNRPGFQSMIEAVEAGKVGTVIVKDMSRFGRNYLQVGFYTEMVFPNNGIRFIAINNNIDSDRPADNDFAPFLNIMNEWYAKDTSNKIKAIFNSRMSEGLRCSGSIPYGYNRIAGDKQTLVVDPVAAEVVRRIYEMADMGKSCADIARALSADKVLIPSAYTARYHPEQNNGIRHKNPCGWNNTTVNAILKRKEYLGHTVLRKSYKSSFKAKKRQKSAEDEQYIFENTHEAIVDSALWERVQRKIKRKGKVAPLGTHSYRLSGFLHCADCGKRLSLQTHKTKNNDEYYYSYRCSRYSNNSRECTDHYISANALEQIILTTIRRFSKFILEDEEDFAERLRRASEEREAAKPDRLEQELISLKKKYDELDAMNRSLYENFAKGILPERQYKSLMRQYDTEQGELEDRIKSLESEKTEQAEKKIEPEKFINLIKKYKEPKEITDRMLDEFIDRIVVHQAEGKGRERRQQVDIYFNFIGDFSIPLTEEEQLSERERLENEEAERQKAGKERRRNYEAEYRRKKREERRKSLEGHSHEKKICGWCGEEFWPNSANQKYCGKECAEACRKQKTKEVRFAEKGEHIFKQKQCSVCGEWFWPTNGRQVMCSEECREKHAAEYRSGYYEGNKEKILEREKAGREAKNEKLMLENEGHLIPKRICEYCGEEYWPTKHHQKYCSKECSRLAYEQMDSGRNPAEKEGHKFYKRICIICGREFWPDSPNAITCSDECSIKRISQRHKKNYREKKGA